MDVLKTEGVLSLVIPDKRHCFDKYRYDTSIAALIDAWVTNQSTPSPRQIYDCLHNAVDILTDKRLYTDEQALQYSTSSWASSSYLDVHCTTYTPESFSKIFAQLNKLGIINCSILKMEGTQGEFFVHITKLGEPKLQRPRKKMLSKIKNVAEMFF